MPSLINPEQYPKLNTKANIINYLTALNIVHNPLHKKDSLLGLLPPDYLQQLPQNWKEFFPAPSPSPRATRKGGKTTSVSGTTSTSAMAVGNPESLASKMSSSTEELTATEMNADNIPLREIDGDLYSVNRGTVVETEHGTTEKTDVTGLELRKIDEPQYSVNTDTTEKLDQRTQETTANTSLRNIDEHQDTVKDSPAQNECVSEQPSETTSKKPATKRKRPEQDSSAENEDEQQKRKKPENSEHLKAKGKTPPTKSKHSDDDFIPAGPASDSESDSDDDEEDDLVDEDIQETLEDAIEPKPAYKRPKPNKEKTKLQTVISEYRQMRGRANLTVVEMPEDISLGITTKNKFWRTKPTKKQKEEMAKMISFNKPTRNVPSNSDTEEEEDEKDEEEEEEEEHEEEDIDVTTTLKYTGRAFTDNEVFDFSGTHRLSAITFFVHQDRNVSLFCQPAMNHRKIMMSTLKKTFLPAAIETDKNATSFEDSIYVIPYEITPTQNYSTGAPIFSAYNIETRFGKVDSKQCNGLFAKYPTIGCVKKTLSLFGMEDITKKHFCQDEQDNEELLPDSKVFVDMLNHPLFMNTVYPCTNLFAGIKSFDQITEKARKLGLDPIVTSYAAYRDIKSHILENTTLRFAILDGQHRVAISLHVLGGYNITNHFDYTAITKRFENYKLSKEMKINGKPTIRFLLPKTHLINEDFTEQCVQASIEIIDRKMKAEGNPWRKVIYDVLHTDEEIVINTDDYFARENTDALRRFLFTDSMYDPNMKYAPFMVSIMNFVYGILFASNLP